MLLSASSGSASDGDLANKPISEFSSTGEEPTVEPKRRLLTVGMIHRGNYSPTRVVDLIQGGDVLRMRQSYRSMVLQFLMLVGVVLCCIVLAVFFPDNVMRILFMGVIGCLAIAASIFHKRRDQMYEIGWDLIAATHGKMADVRKTLTLTTSQLRSTEISQTIIQKIFGVGDVKVSDIVPDQKDIAMENLYQPFFYGEVVRELNKRHQAAASDGAKKANIGS